MSFRSCLLSAALVPALVAQAPETPEALLQTLTGILKGDYAAKLRGESRLPALGRVEGISARLATERDPELRQILIVARSLMVESLQMALPRTASRDVQGLVSSVASGYLMEGAGQIRPEAGALSLVAAVRPAFLSDLAWYSSGGGMVNQSADEAARKATLFLEAVFERHASRDVKALALARLAELWSRPREVAKVAQYTARLKAFMPEHPDLPGLERWLATAKQEELAAPRVGNPVPAFRVADLEHPKAVFTPATFKGKYLLIDFWATWCGPCKGELPFLHKAYAKYHAKGLEVLSISRDRAAKDIAAFRKSPEHPMPWHHAFPEGKAAEQLMDAFQVRGIPHILLVGPEGRILELPGMQLRGEQLDRTLAKHLDK